MQQIVPDENTQFTADPMNQSTEGFVLADMDFDGYVDMRLMQFLPAGPNMPYYFWIWDPESGQMVDRNQDFGHLAAPVFDPAAKRIYCHIRHSAHIHVD